MGILKTFEIIYENEGIFRPGSLLTGHVEIETEGKVPFRNILIIVLGRGSVGSGNKNSEQQNSSNATINFNDEETYFKREIDVASHLLPSDRIIPAKAIQTFPFEFQLPVKIPPSFSSVFGSIDYRVLATFKQGHGHQPIQTSKLFLIEAYVDLNTMSEINKPFWKNKISPTYSLFCFPGGSIEVSFQLRKSIYVPGQTINLSYNITNLSHCRRLTMLRLELKQIAKFRPKKSSSSVDYNGKETSKKIAESYTALNLPYRKESGHSNALLKIPDFYNSENPPTLMHSELISVNYNLVITVLDDSCSYFRVAYYCEVPLILGTIPLNIANGHEPNGMNITSSMQHLPKPVDR